MESLRELRDTRQIHGEPLRRWFTSPDLDLIVWLGEDGDPIGFQLCYDKHVGEHALTWREGRGYDHSFVDDGEDHPAASRTPILRADGHFDSARVRDIFDRTSDTVPPDVRTYVTQALARYPGE